MTEHGPIDEEYLMSNERTTTPDFIPDPHREFDYIKNPENYMVEICETSSNKERLLAYYDAVKRGENND